MQRRAHELGLLGGYYKRGKFNAITDVKGVKVGHTTLIKGKNVRTGATAVIPPIDFSKERFLAGGFAFNANGEMTGLQYIMEEARLISPILLTNTLSVGDVFSAVIEYYKGRIALPVIGECWDGYLNDIKGRHVKREHVFSCIKKAKSGKVEEGCVGAGTGMTSFGFKSGIGTASRILKLGKDGKQYTVGVLVNNNLGHDEGRSRYLTIDGMRIGKQLKITKKKARNSNVTTSSIIIVIATDIPLSHYQMNRVSQHAVLGMGRVGVVSYSGSGDFVVTFSTANKIPQRDRGRVLSIKQINEKFLDNIFEAVIEATEEAIVNSLLMATDMIGKDGNRINALPVEKILANMR